MNNLVDKNCKSVEWYTPPRVLEPVRELFGGRLAYDPCTASHNPTDAEVFSTEEDDGLSKDWRRVLRLSSQAFSTRGTGIFVNPPYGKAMYHWIEKCAQEAARGLEIALLLAASSRWDQPGWHRLFSPDLSAMVLFRGRIKYLDQNGTPTKSPPYPSILFTYNLYPHAVEGAFPPPDKVVKFH